MKAIRVHEFGGPEILKLDEVATPKPAAGDVCYWHKWTWRSQSSMSAFGGIADMM
jgi:hypothetical protein